MDQRNEGMRGAEHGYLQLMVVQGGGDNVARQCVQGQWRLMRAITRQLDNSALLVARTLVTLVSQM